MGNFEVQQSAQDTYLVGVQRAIRELLESKHLYQSIGLDALVGQLTKLMEDYLVEPSGGRSTHVLMVEDATKFLAREWQFHRPNAAIHTKANPNHLYLRLSHVNIHCPQCDRVEAHNPVFDSDLPSVASEHDPAGGVVQWLTVAYQCQSCKGLPVVFLVHRSADKLTLSGRSPIETVSVQKFIPKGTKQYYSTAIVAHQSGQTLAGLFLLRTFIEQTARQAIESPDPNWTGDQLLEAYTATLHGTLRSDFPSMKCLYGELSADIHTATGSTVLFDKAIADIDKHFDAKRLFATLAKKASEPPTSPQS